MRKFAGNCGRTVGTIRAKSSRLPERRSKALTSSDDHELVLLACLATRAEGMTTVRGAQELRVKESDRISTVVQNLQAIGARAEETPDGFIVHGSPSPLSGMVRTRGDHRVAMAFGVLASLPGNDIHIDDPSCVAVSYPAFWDDVKRLTR